MVVEEEQALGLAWAVARPGSRALLIAPNNESLGWVAVEEAVAGGRSFAVNVDEDMLALDADDEAKGRFVEEILAPEISSKGISPVVIASGRPGHRHLFARIEDRRLKRELADRAQERGIDVRRTIRPPLSPHRLGLAVALLSPSSVTEALKALQPTKSPTGWLSGHSPKRIFVTSLDAQV
jgi:hypothetical protein